MQETPPIDVIDELLERDEMAIDAAELHGSLCAQAAISVELEPGQWLRRALGRELDPAGLTDDLRGLLDWMFDWTLASLDDPELGFRLLLPDDEEAIAERVAALTHWCGGFVSGYGAAVAGAEHELPAEAREFLSDLAEIAQADLELDGAEDEEAAYAQLIEYARVGAMLMFDTLRGPAPGEAAH